MRVRKCGSTAALFIPAKCSSPLHRQTLLGTCLLDHSQRFSNQVVWVRRTRGTHQKIPMQWFTCFTGLYDLLQLAWESMSGELHQGGFARKVPFMKENSGLRGLFLYILCVLSCTRGKHALYLCKREIKVKTHWEFAPLVKGEGKGEDSVPS